MRGYPPRQSRGGLNQPVPLSPYTGIASVEGSTNELDFVTVKVNDNAKFEQIEAQQLLDRTWFEIQL